MAAAPLPTNVLRLPEPAEGEIEGTDDILFFRLGSSVPLTPSCSNFDLEDPPVRPLAISERFRLLFLAYSEGFLVAKTKDVIGLAKKIKVTADAEKEKGVKEKAKRPSIQESSIVDMRVGKVSILAPSKDSSFLAATIGGNIRVFSLHSLIKKQQEPLLSCCLHESDHVKDFKWCQNKDKSFIALSDSDSLYHGNIDGSIVAVMDDVKAVDCSTDGDFFIIARKDTISILSLKFDELLQIPITQASTDPSCNFTVDSVKWIHSNVIILGCIQFSDGGGEDAYQVQVIKGGEHGFKALSQLRVVSFSDLFHGYGNSLSSKGGPLLFASYLDRWGLALVANRKNMDDHVVLLELPVNNRREEAVGLELEQEKFFPRIELQENGDENLMLGLDVDNISLYEKLEYEDQEEVRELSPYCIALCLSSEGKLIMFYITRISDPSIPLQDPSEDPDEYVAITNHSGDEHVNISIPRNEQGNVPRGQPLNFGEPTMAKSNELGINLTSLSTEKHSDQVFNLNISGMSATTIPSSVGNLQSATFGSRKQDDALFARQDEMNSGFTNPNNLKSGSLGLNSVGIFGSQDKTSTNLSSFVSLTSTNADSQDHFLFQKSPTAFQKSAVNSQFGLKISASKEPVVCQKVGQTMMYPDLSSSAVARSDGSVQEHAFGVNNSAPNIHGVAEEASESFESDISEQFYSVNDMVKELDRLLKNIEQPGGFADACTVHLKSSILALEKGLENLSQKSRACKDAVAEVIVMVHHLQDKMVQISAWEGYMEGIVKQASDNEYWDIWNRQKLGPEFELKQQQILEMNHILRNQIVDLERHFNMLELKKFGEGGGDKARRLLHNSDTSRRIQMLHNTVNSQLTAAEHLAECLSGQMASLKISSPDVKQQSITKELLESIGFDNHIDSFESPDVKRAGFSPDSFKKISLSSQAARQSHKTNTYGAFKSVEPETTRRRRDSLDRSWSCFEPQKATVKRISYQKAFKGSLDGSYRDSQIARGIAFSPVKPSGSTVQNHMAATDTGEKTLKQSSLFTRASEFSEPCQVVESKSFKSPVEVAQTSKIHPSLVSSQAINFQNLTYGNSTDELSFEVASAGGIDLSSRKVSSFSNNIYNLENTSTITGSPSEVQKYILSPNNPTAQVHDLKINLQDKPSVRPESGGKFHPSPSMEEGKLDCLDNALKSTKTYAAEITVCSSVSKTTHVMSNDYSSSLLQSSSISPSSALPSLSKLSSHFLPSDTPIKVPVPAMASEVSSDVSKSSIGTIGSTKTAPMFSAISSQPLFTSIPAIFGSQNSQSLNSPSTPVSSTSDAQSSCTSVVSSTRNIDVSSTAVTNAFSEVSSQLQPSTVTSTMNMFPGVSSLSSKRSSSIPNTESKAKEVIPDVGCQEDEMDEEAPEAPAIFGLGGIGLFGLGSATTQSVPKTNPFGGSFVTSASATPSTSPACSLAIPPGELFKPASFSVPSFQQTQSSPSANPTGVSGGFSGFGKPAQIGMGQQALGSVLGTFGQSRQLGGTQGIGPGGFGGSPAPGTPTGGFAASTAAGVGFAASTSGGFAALASKSGGFAGTAKGGGFAGIASSSGGFAGAASGGGFSALSSGGGGFATTSTGGFGNGTGSGRPPVEVLMQMRK